MNFLHRQLALILSLLFAIMGTSPAHADVEISFYSRELGMDGFPSAFITLKGEPGSGGAPHEIGYGFVTNALAPIALLRSVNGMVTKKPPAYVAKSDRQFSVVLSDERYKAVTSVITKWSAKPQPSYNLNKSNCVHFVQEIAQAVGLNATVGKDLMKKPRLFLLAVKSQNTAIISAGKAPPMTNAAQGTTP